MEVQIKQLMPKTIQQGEIIAIDGVRIVAPNRKYKERMEFTLGPF